MYLIKLKLKLKLKFFFRVIYSFLILKPIFTRQDNTNAFQWRIRNMVYPLENYIVELDEENKSIIIKTKNKK